MQRSKSDVRNQKIKCISDMHHMELNTKRVQIETAKLMIGVEKVKDNEKINPLAEVEKEREKY